jgi:hemolysin III
VDHGERFNSISHMAGAVLAVLGAVALIVPAAEQGDPWKIVSFSVYGAMLLALFMASTLYHSSRSPAKKLWCKFDHCAIYLLIAGSYTPFTLVSLRGGWGWGLFGTVWGLALLGIVQEIWLAKGPRILSLVIYVVMGWLALIAIGPLLAVLKLEGFLLLALGGLLYTIGIGFYATDHRLRYGHGIWHMFVLAGSACHYFTVLLYVA